MNGQAYPAVYGELYGPDRARSHAYGADRIKAQQRSFSDLTSRSMPSTQSYAARALKPEHHSPLRALCIILAFLSVCFVLFFYILADTHYGYDLGIYKEGFWNSSKTVQINSDRVIFYMSFVNCGTNILWLVYALSTLCRSTSLGPLYVYPTPLPTSLFVLVFLTCGLLLGWTLMWDSEYIELACLMSFLAALLFHIAQAVTAKQLDNMKDLLVSTGRSADYWLTQVLVLNGLAFSAGFYTVVAHVDLALVLSYGKLTSMAPEDSSRVALSMLGLLILVHAVLDFFYLDRWMRYTVTPYLPVVAVLIGACVKNWALEDVTVIFAAALLCTCLIGFFIKVIFVVARHLRDNPTKRVSGSQQSLCEMPRS